MNIRCYTSDSYHLFQVFGSLEIFSMEEFNDKIEEAFVSHRQKVVFDFRETISVDAATVRYLERFAQAITSIGKQLCFVSLEGQPSEMLDLLCLLRNIETFPSIEAFNSAGTGAVRKHRRQPQPTDSDASYSMIMLISLMAALWQAQSAPER